MMLTRYLTSLCLYITITTLSVYGAAETSADRIEAFIQSAIEPLSVDFFQSSMRGKYKTLRLRDDSSWKTKKLGALEGVLFPHSTDTVRDFLHEVTYCVKKNPYLVEAINAFTQEEFLCLQEKLQQDGSLMIGDIVAHAMVLENLTREFAKDITMFDEVNALWDEEKKKIQPYKNFSHFSFIKYCTLNRLQCVSQTFNENKINADFLTFGLPLNILEAAFTDLLAGNFKNFFAGLVLAANGPIAEKNDALGTGPAFLTKDVHGRQAFNLSPPRVKEWNDLYTVWNLGFLSTYKHFPYIMTKLLIPAVNGHMLAPNAYMSHRGIALYTQLTYDLFLQYDGGFKMAINQWKINKITSNFGYVNRQSAKDYLGNVDRQMIATSFLNIRRIINGVLKRM